MPSKVIIANWKMNLSVKKSLEFVRKIIKSQNELVIAAPFTFLCEMSKHLKKKKIKLAGQNVSQFSEGAYTGDVSAKMLKEEGCTYCLVGHSERRIYFKETDSEINGKIRQLLKYEIKPILCVGENYLQRKRKLTNSVLAKQLAKDLQGIKVSGEILIAYEPIWAISTFQENKNKKAASLEDIISAHQRIKKILQKLFKNTKKIKIIYGGTVTPLNSSQILNLKEVEGVLVGGASLKVPSLNAIIKAI